MASPQRDTPRYASRAIVRRAFRWVIAPLCATGLALMFLASPALAHDSLKSSTPAGGAVVSELGQIVLEFHDRVSFPAVVLHDTAGKRFDAGEARADGSKVYEDVAAPVPPGAYVIAWRVVSSDGHPIEGEIPFTVTGASGAAAGATAASPGTTTPATTGTLTATTTTGSSGGGIPGWAWAGIVIVVLVAAGVGLRTARPAREGDSDQATR